MASFPAGVTVVTTTDAKGTWHGFTATSFCSVSKEPPLVSVCLAHTAACHDVFTAAGRWAVHVLRSEDSGLAVLFATRGADKFAGGRFTPDRNGLPVLDKSVARLTCRTDAVHPAGDHTILVGRVEDLDTSAGESAVYYRRGFYSLRSAKEAACTS
ncbi:flavin reductase family protein [Amycolatopsis sp. NPDC098790]|uniref:flavin reductase family protein n=1 Tax=Amycolatopsis sp. NPDC098790 TaxID=3363939 RepID=UPI0037FCD621